MTGVILTLLTLIFLSADSVGEKAREKVIKRLEKLHSDSEEDSDALSATSYDIPSDKEYTLTSITGRKAAEGKQPTTWFAHFDDGDERWEPITCFIDDDGTTNELFEKFQEDHPGEGDVPLPTNNKRTSPSEKTNQKKKPKLKRELSDASKYLDDLNKELLSTSVSSSDIQSAEDMIKIKEEAKSLTKKEVRSSRIAEKERESKAIASSLKKHQETVESQATVQSTMQMMALQMMQKMMKEDVSDEDVSELKKEIVSIKSDFKTVNSALASIQATQSQMASILSELVKK